MPRRVRPLHARRSASTLVVLAALIGSTLAVVPPGGPRPVRATDGPIAHWTFDEGSGTTAEDSAGSFDGALEGDATWVTSGAKVGTGALAFDGAGDGVRVMADSGLEPASLTIAAWMRSTSVATFPVMWQSLVQKGVNMCEAGSWGIDVAHFGTIGRLRQQVDIVPGPEWIGAQTPDARLWDGEWHHVAFTHDSPSNQAYLYVDGRQFPGFASPLAYGQGSSGDLFIGRIPVTCSSERDFSGELDDLRVYDRALSPTELSALTPGTATTSTLSVLTPTVTWGDEIKVDITVVPAPSSPHVVRLYHAAPSGPELFATGATDASDGVARFRLKTIGTGPYPAAGTYVLTAELEGSGGFLASTSGSSELRVSHFPTSTTLTVSGDDLLPDSPVTLRAAVSWSAGGTVTFTDSVDGGVPVTLGTSELQRVGGDWKTTLELASLPIGTHAVRATANQTDVAGASTSAPVTVSVHKRPTETIVSAIGTPQANHPVTLEIDVRPIGAWPITQAPGGSVILRDGSTTLGTASVTNGEAAFTIPSLAVGAHAISAEYGGNAYHLGSTGSSPITVNADVVEVSGMSVTPSPFYPYVDSFRDTVAIRGTRGEPIAVAIRIYNSSNVVVRSASIAQGSGNYTYSWNGRTSSGAILPAGQYRVVQTLTDAAGTRQVFTNLVTLSLKKLVTYTAYVAQNGNSYDASGRSGTGRITSSSTGYVKLDAGANGWAGAGWEFALPSATVYKSITFQVRSKTPSWVPYPAQMGIQNFTVCPYSATSWNESCFERWRALGHPLNQVTWYAVAGSVTENRHGRIVRGTVSQRNKTSIIYKAQIKVVYAVLR